MIVIRKADPGAPDMRVLIEANVLHGAGAAPAESDHTFGVEQLQGAEVMFCAAYDGSEALIGNSSQIRRDFQPQITTPGRENPKWLGIALNTHEGLGYSGCALRALTNPARV